MLDIQSCTKRSMLIGGSFSKEQTSQINKKHILDNADDMHCICVDVRKKKLTTEAWLQVVLLLFATSCNKALNDSFEIKLNFFFTY